MKEDFGEELLDFNSRTLGNLRHLMIAIKYTEKTSTQIVKNYLLASSAHVLLCYLENPENPIGIRILRGPRLESIHPGFLDYPGSGF